jgi:hypothetical protein
LTRTYLIGKIKNGGGWFKQFCDYGELRSGLSLFLPGGDIFRHFHEFALYRIPENGTGTCILNPKKFYTFF